MAARVSPPPAMENAGLSAMAIERDFVPSPNWSNSNTPTGPFQMMVPAFLSMSANFLDVSGPTSKIISSSSTLSALLSDASAVSSNAFPHTTSVGTGISPPLSLAFRVNRLASSIRSSS